MMPQFDTMEECMIELAPFGSFPIWSPKDVRDAELPGYENVKENELIFA
jgi:hypothetical protein